MFRRQDIKTSRRKILRRKILRRKILRLRIKNVNFSNFKSPISNFSLFKTELLTSTKNNVTLELNETAGIYLYTIIDKAGNRKTGKFVIQ